MAEAQVTEAIRLVGQPGFERAVWGMMRASVAPDNLVILAYGNAATQKGLYQCNDHAQVIAEMNRT